MTAGSTRSFPVPSGTCPVPSTATAYSFNVTVVPAATLQYLTIWPTGSTQPVVSTLNSYAGQVVANAAIVPSGTSGAVSVYVTDATDVIIDINGYFSVQTDSTTGSTKFGLGALTSDAGGENTGIGNSALTANTSGTDNSALGYSALQHNTTGAANTGIGMFALSSNTTGGANTAVGYNSQVFNTTSSYNTAVGNGAMESATGSLNTAIGYNALSGATGSVNTALGQGAGQNITGGNYNIDIGNVGSSSDAGVIRLGTAGSQTSAYSAGISGVAVTGAAVIVSSTGQLGVAASSIRYKEDVHDLQAHDKALMQLRPVSFRYKGTTPMQFGLIAEEVDKVYPELVARDSSGQPMSVQYHELPVLLLNEIQRQHKTIELLEKRLADLEAMLKK